MSSPNPTQTQTPNPDPLVESIVWELKVRGCAVVPKDLVNIEEIRKRIKIRITKEDQTHYYIMRWW